MRTYVRTTYLRIQHCVSALRCRDKNYTSLYGTITTTLEQCVCTSPTFITRSLLKPCGSQCVCVCVCVWGGGGGGGGMYNNTWSQFIAISESAVPDSLGAARLRKCNRNPFTSELFSQLLLAFLISASLVSDLYYAVTSILPKTRHGKRVKRLCIHLCISGVTQLKLHNRKVPGSLARLCTAQCER